ncbi:MAG: hypothetical protein ACHRXM_31150, partial [Isosphaerales bacterium]
IVWSSKIFNNSFTEIGVMLTMGHGMVTRRQFIGIVGAGLVGETMGFAAEPAPGLRKRMAVVTTEWRYHSHAWHMAERFLVAYPNHGRWHRPSLDVVAAYVDQSPRNDLSRKRSAEFGFPIFPTIAQALRCGGDKLAVDAVLIIGEHGNYPKSEFGQTKYPRYEFFKQVTDVFRKDGRAVPVFNDKHLSWKWEWAKEMVETSRELNFGFAAGSSLSTLFHLPPNPNVVYSAALMSKAEETFLTGKSPCPIERTLLTSGLVEAGMRSLGTGQKRLETPHLGVRYQVPPQSTFWRT